MDKTRAMLRELEEFSASKTVVSRIKMSELSRKVIVWCVVLRGVRVQVFGDAFSRADFFAAVDGEPASFPYLPVTGNHELDRNDGNVRNYTTCDAESGSRIYTRPDPFVEDPNDPADPCRAVDGQLMTGVAVKIKHHKTGALYPFWLWFSETQTLYLKMYEEIATNYLIHHQLNIDPNTGVPKGSSPFFISGSGAATYNVKMEPLDFSDFCTAAGIPPCTSVLFRKMFSNLLLAQKDIALRECEEFVMCHAPNTAKSFYVDDVAKKMKAMQGNVWYQAILLEHDTTAAPSSGTSSRKTFTSREQAQRQALIAMETRRELLEKRIRYQDKVEASVVPTKERVTTNTTRAALIKLIGKSGREMMELFMTE